MRRLATVPVLERLIAGGRRQSIACAVMVLTGLVGAGCAGDSDDETRACPSISILADAAQLSRYADGSRKDILDLNYRVDFADLLAGCKFKKIEGAPNVIKVGLSPVFVVTLGAANQDRQAPFNYFVSVVTADRQILTKQIFEMDPQFPPGRARIVTGEYDTPIAIDIPLGEGRSARDYAIMVGLQLTEAELLQNREGAGDSNPWTRP